MVDERFEMSEYDKTLAKVLFDIYKNSNSYIDSLRSLKSVIALKAFKQRDTFETYMHIIKVDFEIGDIQDVCMYMDRFYKALTTMYKEYFNIFTRPTGVHARNTSIYNKQKILHWKLINYLKQINKYDDIRESVFIKDKMRLRTKTNCGKKVKA